MISSLRAAVAQRVLLLDGAMGTEIQNRSLREADFRFEMIAEHPVALAGNNDLLVLSRPDVIRNIHQEYLKAGADIIETCTFSSNEISQADYGTEALVERLNMEGARLARQAADEFTRLNPERPRFVAGSVGPTTKLLCFAEEGEDLTFERLENAYYRQMTALAAGGVDAILVETVVDTLNAKAALAAYLRVKEETPRPLELMVSISLADDGRRILSGQTIEAFVASIAHAEPLSIGLNCSFGADRMLPGLRTLRSCAGTYISCHPNAGLPDQFGHYGETPERLCCHAETMLREGLVNIIGGCCGTSPAHIAHLCHLIDRNPAAPAPAPAKPRLLLAGLEPLDADVAGFVNVGERCNVAGSRKFLRLIKEGAYEEAAEIARSQVEAGAMMLDINLDDPMLDATAEICRFLRLIGSDPVTARVPVMIDSSDFALVERAVTRVQGKPVVNSISLKDGEEPFLRKARKLRRLGAAMIVMAFDEQGQATDFERKCSICARAYRLLTERAGVPPEDIIFDPNILTVGTGVETDRLYALDFVRATRWIRENLPGAGVSGGLSNLSFAFRGNNPLREAMHAVFLRRAVAEGMTMAIMNPSSSVTYDSIPDEMRLAIEDLLFGSMSAEACENLTRIASEAKEKGAEKVEVILEDRTQIPVDQRLRQALVDGDMRHLEPDLAEALAVIGSPLKIVEGPLMEGMNEVGVRFGEGRMFLPQVVKTARTMKRAVEILEPYMESAGSAPTTTSGTALLATVKGDVHDIGKNIVGIILSCNSFRVVDLGVMTPPEAIVEAAIAEKPDFIGLSGLITPSLAKMAESLQALQNAGLEIPVMVGGAATSSLHTAVMLAPLYDGPVVHVRDASRNPIIAAKLQDPEYRSELRAEQERLRQEHEAKNRSRATLEEARRLRYIDRRDTLVDPPFIGVRDTGLIPLENLIPKIDWLYFYHAWRVKQGTPEAESLLKDALEMLETLKMEPGMGALGRVGFFAATPRNESIIIGDVEINAGRQTLREGMTEALSLADFVAETDDHVGAFAATVSAPFVARLEALKADGADDYQALLMQTLGDRLAEAAAEYIHAQVTEQTAGAWRGIRPAVGYPSFPHQEEIFKLDVLLEMGRLGIRLTETGAMYPQASVAGLLIGNPAARYF